MKKYNTIIVGGGASGCMAAMTARDKSLAIIDSGKSLAKKLMVTGNGRCNLTNTNMSSEYFNENIDKFLKRFDEKKTLEFFEAIGLETYADSESRVYPISNSAKSVVDVILNRLQNVDAILGESVKNIERNGKAYIVTTDKETYECNRLVVACGGGAMLENIKKLGVDVKLFVPSLVALKSSQIKDLNGVKLADVKVTAKCGNVTKSECGEVLFKDGGISGIVVFNLSSIFARSGNFCGEISIDILPNMSESELVKKLRKRTELNVNADKLFVGMFLSAVANEIFKNSKVNTNKNSLKLTDEELEKLAHTIKNLTYHIDGYFDNNQVFSGGVKLASLDENLQVNKVPNMYFAGEICDIDGVCGGYNLQWAWTSGRIVGEKLC